MIEKLLHQEKLSTEEHFPGPLQDWQQQGQHFRFSDGLTAYEILFFSPSVFRFRMAPQGEFLDGFSYAVVAYPEEALTVRAEETEEAVWLKTPELQLKMAKAGMLLSVFDGEGHLLNQDAKGPSWQNNFDHGGYYLACRKTQQAQENFFGLGDKATEAPLWGKRFTLWNTDSYAFQAHHDDPLYRAIPFYIGLHSGLCYGLFYDNTFHSSFDFSTKGSHQVTYRAPGGELCYYFIAGPQMQQVVRRYAGLTGTTPMPPQWALGYQQSRWSYYPESRFHELAQTFRQKQIPCDVLYFDIDYMQDYKCFTWNQAHFPDPPKLLTALREQGFKGVAIIDPGLKKEKGYPIYEEARRKGFLCARGDDYLMEGSVWPGNCVFPDFTNPRARLWWGKLYKGLLEDGMAGFWNDMNEPSVFSIGTFPEDVRHDFDGHPCSHRKAHNVYGQQMIRATYDGLVGLQGNERPFTLSRAGYAGMQRYGATWTGDNVASWEHLWLANVQCQRMNLSGVPFIGSDIGGFSEDPDGELFVRWVQLGVFHPLMRVHSAQNTAEQEPWSFGPEVEALCKRYIELRYQLLPYLYTVFWEHHRYGDPMLRPIVYLEQEEPRNLFRQDEFGLGDKLLVSPVLEAGAQGRSKYLPKGDWYFFWTNELHQGGQEIWVDTPLDTLPLFVKAGTLLPWGPVQQYVGEKTPDSLELLLYTGLQELTSRLYEDDGHTQEYRTGHYLERQFHFAPTATGFRIRQEAAGAFASPYQKFCLKMVGGRGKPHWLSCDGEGLTPGVDVEGYPYVEVPAGFAELEAAF